MTITILTTLLVADMYNCNFHGVLGPPGWGNQILLEVFKGLLCLLSPLELVMFLDELKERESPDAKSQDGHSQNSHAPCQLLDIMEVLGWLHFSDSRHLLWVRIDSVTGDHITK
jgi:hypothetical protein